MAQKPIWFRQEQENTERIRQILLAQPDGGILLLRDTVASLSADAERRELEACEEECASLLGRMADAVRRLADAMPRQNALFSRVGEQDERAFFAYCSMIRVLDADARKLDEAVLSVSSIGHALAKRIPAFFRAEMLCRTAMDICAVRPAAEQALGELTAKRQEYECLTEQIRFIRGAVDCFCRQNLTNFCTGAERLADADHKGAGLRPAALATLCGDFIHAAMVLAGQIRRKELPDKSHG